MSPKTSKNKKGSKDPKRPDTSMESRSAPSYDTDYHSLSQGSAERETNVKVDQDYDGTDVDDVHVDLGEELPDLPKDEDEIKDTDDNSQYACKATEYFSRFAKAIIKVFGPDKEQLMVFPMLVRNFIGPRGYFYSLKDINHVISDMIDSELERKGFCPYFVTSFATSYGFEIDSRIALTDTTIGEELYLNDHNYQDHLFSTYMEDKIIVLHIHVDEDIMKPIKRGPDCPNYGNVPPFNVPGAQNDGRSTMSGANVNQPSDNFPFDKQDIRGPTAKDFSYVPSEGQVFQRHGV